MINTDFDNEVVQQSLSIPVLVDFWAPWCAPCRALTPILEQVAERHRDRFVFVKVNTEEQPDIAERYRIRSIPTVKLFVDGQAINEFTGAMPAEMIEEWLKRALPSRERERLKKAEGLIAVGQLDEAAAMLDDILAAEPDNVQAAVILGQLLLPKSHREAAETVARIGPDSDFFAAAEAIRTFARLFDVADDPSALPDSSAKGAYLAAAKQLKQGDYAQALQGFIGVARSARSYDDDGARKACVAIFKLLGDEHELTRKYRGLLSSALYV